MATFSEVLKEKLLLGSDDEGKGDYVALAVETPNSEVDLPLLGGEPPLASRRSVQSKKTLKRRLLILAGAITVFLLGAAFSPFRVHDLASPALISSFHKHFNGASPTRVGRRKVYNLYHGRGCNSSQLLDAVAKAQVREDGRSRVPWEHAEGEGENDLDLSNFEYSYDIEGCPAPHKFTAEEACDLVSAFGGIFSRGDSLMRQWSQGVFLLLESSFDQVKTKKEYCAGNKLFTNGVECKFDSIFDTREMPSHRCPSAAMFYDLTWKFQTEVDPVPVVDGKADYGRALLEGFERFIKSLTEEQRRYSPIFVEGTGIHYQWHYENTLAYHIEPFTANYSSTTPRPIPFFSAYPAVPPNKTPAWQLPPYNQDAAHTQEYNEIMRTELRKAGKESWEGGWTVMDWYNSTVGAFSYDGTHFDTQVALERGNIFLNVLDTLWGEIVEHGGLVQ
ncbi:hypothetical protein JCM8097_001140 [Rhodosporidiobolus ruineniae]